jgi:N utilization substance protein A
MDALDVDDVIAHLLVAEGFQRLEEIAYVAIEELTSIEGFDADIAEELQHRAQVFLEERNRTSMERAHELGLSQDLETIEALEPPMLLKLAENGVKTLDDLADLASDELIEIVGKSELTLDEANDIIMAARAHWFAEEDGGAPGPAAAAAGQGGAQGA